MGAAGQNGVAFSDDCRKSSVSPKSLPDKSVERALELPLLLTPGKSL